MFVCFLQPCGHLLGKGWPLLYDVSCVFLTYPYSDLDHVWYLNVLIPDLCILPYFEFFNIHIFSNLIRYSLQELAIALTVLKKFFYFTGHVQNQVILESI